MHDTRLYRKPGGAAAVDEGGRVVEDKLAWHDRVGEGERSVVWGKVKKAPPFLYTEYIGCAI